MTAPKILYDIQHFNYKDLVEHAISEIEDEQDIEINLDIAGPPEVTDKLKSNPNYDLVVLHMGTSEEGAYKQANELSRLTDAVFIAESVVYPENKSEVLEHFDEYVGQLTNKENWEKLLEKYAFISEQ